ncbi:MAG: metallophosphoesterase [Solirubrobacterales bacterium]
MVRVHRTFLTTAVAVCALGATWALAGNVQKLDIVHGPYVQAVTESSAVVVWFTNKPCVSRVEYGPEDSNEVTTAVASRHGLIDANTTVHKIPLTGLKAGIRYRYRVISTEIVQFDPYKVVYGDTITAGPYRVQTWSPQKDKFSFCVVNDIHEKADRLNSLLSQVSLDTTDMVFLNGDIVDHWTREDQVFGGFLDVCVRRFARQTPFVYVRGNHETRGALARNLIDWFPTPSREYYYAFRHGPVSFLVLDSGEDKPDSNAEYSGLVNFEPYMAEQTAWLRRAIQERSFKESRYRIALLHMPPVAKDEREYGSSRIYKLWAPLLNEANLDLTLCGHVHLYARVDPNQSGCGFPILVNAPDTIVNIDVSDSQLDVTVKKVDGQLVDQFAMKPRTQP